MAIASTEAAYCLADTRSDAGDKEAAQALNYCACLADDFRRKLARLSYACLDKSAAKRRAAVELLLMELDASGEMTAEFPMRALLQPRVSCIPAPQE